MKKIDKFLIFYCKHDDFYDWLFTSIGLLLAVLVFPALNGLWLIIFMLIWTTIFLIVPVALANFFLRSEAKKRGLIERRT